MYTYTYDDVHRLTGIETPLGYQQNLFYSDADDVLKTSDSMGRTSFYEYDVMHRLTGETNPEGGVTIREQYLNICGPGIMIPVREDLSQRICIWGISMIR